jgi:hypothetical protein
MRQCVSPLLGFTALLLVSAPVVAQTQPEAACAAYDVHVLTKIEDLANEGIHGSQPAEWFKGLQVARALCHDQRVTESIALYTGMEQILPQSMSIGATAQRYRPMPQEPTETAAITAPTTTLTIAPQDAAVGGTIDLGDDADLPVPLVPLELNVR